MTEITHADPIRSAVTRFLATVEGIKHELERRRADPEHDHVYAWAAGSYEGAILTLRATVDVVRKYEATNG